mmetsp:Transcript_1600/g.5514  ORF Transcript_1600/g.5514 Transcript_1600/m.5514 type:complete len:491 (-) Transcript_1600:641-2113(-)
MKIVSKDTVKQGGFVTKFAVASIESNASFPKQRTFYAPSKYDFEALSPETTISVSVEDKFAHYLSDDLEWAVVLCLPHALLLKERLSVSGKVSREFSQWIEGVKTTFALYFGLKAEATPIEYDEISNDTLESPLFVGSCFSGGVDSYYTLLKGLTETNRVDHVVFAEALNSNVPVGNTKLLEMQRQAIAKTCNELGVTLIRMLSDNFALDIKVQSVLAQRTPVPMQKVQSASAINYKGADEAVFYRTLLNDGIKLRGNSHQNPYLGPRMWCFAVSLKQMFKKFRIPAHIHNSEVLSIKYASCPIIDNQILAGRVEHHGGNLSRLDKLGYIVSAVGLEQLRETIIVCWAVGWISNIDVLSACPATGVIHSGLFKASPELQQGKAYQFINNLHTINCGACEKCLRTLLELAVLGVDVSDMSPSFPPTSVDAILKKYVKTGSADSPYIREIIRHLQYPEHARKSKVSAQQVEDLQTSLNEWRNSKHAFAVVMD